MRLIGGTLARRRLAAPPGRDVRPTPARVKESLFAILGDRLCDAVVLDLFAGSGALGFEALSRGAAFVTFVEANSGTAALVRETARALALEGRSEVIVSRAEHAAERSQRRYDVVFADPPYDDGFPQAALDGFAQRGAFTAETLVVYEHASRTAIPTPGFVAARSERYGEVAIEFLRVSASAQ